MVSWLSCYELFQIRDLFSAFRNELLLTACNFRASNFSHRSSPAAVFKTPPKSRHHKSWIWRVKTTVHCNYTHFTPKEFLTFHFIPWFSSGSSASGTLSRNHQGSREDLHSAESRDSRVSTHANSQSSSVYDNVQKVRHWSRQVTGGL